jgi:hypothetical protein
MAGLFVAMLASTSILLAEKGGSKLSVAPPILAGHLGHS